METNNNIPQWVLKEAVKDCKDVYEFAYKYRKPDRFTGRGKEHEQALMNSHLEDLERRGYTTIAHHDNVTGRLVAFMPNANELNTI